MTNIYGSKDRKRRQICAAAKWGPISVLDLVQLEKWKWKGYICGYPAENTQNKVDVGVIV